MLKRFLFLSILFMPFLPLAATASMWIPSAPNVSAKSYIIVDYDSLEVLASKEPDVAYAPASITKIMTAYVIYHALAQGIAKMDDQVKVSTKAWRTQGSRMFIEAGDRVPFDQLLSGMVVQSGNDASIALAEHIAGSEASFVSMMNLQAKRLGMTGSHFENVTGLPSDEHYMTARDIAILVRALINEFPGHYQRYSRKKFTYNNITQRNRNELLWSNLGVDGVKTGFTETAGYCLASSARQGAMRLISVVLNDKSKKSRFTSTAELLRYGFRFFQTKRVVEAQQAMATMRVWKGEPETVQLGVLRDLYATYPKNNEKSVKTEVTADNSTDAPVLVHTAFGSVKVYVGEKLVQEEPLVAIQGAKEGGIITRISDSVLRLFQ